MDPALKEAAGKGDVSFLREALSTQQSDYFLTQTPEPEEEEEEIDIGGNILHLSAWRNRLEFIKEALKILPFDIQKQLLFQSNDKNMWTPLHAAAVHSYVSYEIVVLFKRVYEDMAAETDEKDGEGEVVKLPWLAVTTGMRTPLHMAVKDDKKNEKCAMEILGMDPKLGSCAIVDVDGNTPLYYALKNGFSLVAEKILMSPLSSSSVLVSTEVLTPFAHAANCSDSVVRLLFKKYGEFLDKIDDENGFSILHKWAEDGEARPCKLLAEETDLGDDLRTKVFKQLIIGTENNLSDTPLHIAARKKDSELAQILIRAYQQQVGGGGDDEGGVNQELAAAAVADECPPWRVKNNRGNTPLHTALYSPSDHFELALEILSIDPTTSKIRNNSGESYFLIAVKAGYAPAIDKIMEFEDPSFQMLRRNDGTIRDINIISLEYIIVL